MFWVVNGVVRTDLPQNLTIRVTSKLDLVAYFASTDKYSVAFLDANTKLLGVNFVATSDDLTLPTNPSRQGANFLGWAPIANYDETTPELTPVNSGSKTYFVAKYAVTDTTDYTVTINGVQSTHKLNDVVTAETTNANFSYWMDVDSGAILSHSPINKFSVLNQNVTIQSIHEGAKNEPMVSIKKFFDFKVGYDSFIGHYELDETLYELIEVGFIHDDYLTNPHISKSINEETNEFMLTTPDSGVGNNHYKMRAYMKQVEKGVENAPVQTVKNKSSYSVTLETTVGRSDTKDTIYAVGSFNGWRFTDGFVTLTKDETGKYVATTPLTFVGEPGHVYEYKYVSATSAYDPSIDWTQSNIAWDFGQNENDNFIIILGNEIGGSKASANHVSDFKNHPDAEFVENTIRVYVKDVREYPASGFHLHYWKGSDHTSWPGLAMQLSLNGYIDVPNSYFTSEDKLNAIVSINNGGFQSEDLILDKGYSFISITGTHNQNPNERFSVSNSSVPKWDINYIPAP